MLFPIKEASERHKEEESQNISIHGQIISPKVYYMKQTVGNSCGTVGLIHTIFNCLDHLTVTPGSFVENFFSASRNMTPEERAEYLANDDQIEIAHKSAATEGISEPIQVEVDTHFVCFT
jgi:ubiquitin carboxyl-terminal hydrolase L3